MKYFFFQNKLYRGAFCEAPCAKVGTVYMQRQYAHIELGGGVAQWLGRRISDRGSLVRTPAGAHFVVALKSHLPRLVLIEPRKRWTDDRLGQTVTRLEITLCLMC